MKPMSKTGALKQARAESSLYRQGSNWILSTWSEATGCHELSHEMPWAVARQARTDWIQRRAEALVSESTEAVQRWRQCRADGLSAAGKVRRHMNLKQRQAARSYGKLLKRPNSPKFPYALKVARPNGTVSIVYSGPHIDPRDRELWITPDGVIHLTDPDAAPAGFKVSGVVTLNASQIYAGIARALATYFVESDPEIKRLAGQATQELMNTETAP